MVGREIHTGFDVLCHAGDQTRVVGVDSGAVRARHLRQKIKFEIALALVYCIGRRNIEDRRLRQCRLRGHKEQKSNKQSWENLEAFHGV